MPPRPSTPTIVRPGNSGASSSSVNVIRQRGQTPPSFRRTASSAGAWQRGQAMSSPPPYVKRRDGEVLNIVIRLRQTVPGSRTRRLRDGLPTGGSPLEGARGGGS